MKTVRYCADIGLVSAPCRTDSGYRTYDDDAVRKLVFIRRAREFGFSIGECREMLSIYEDQHRSSADVKRIATTRPEAIDYEGTSGSMDWDANGDLRRGHIGVWHFTGDERIEEVRAVAFGK